MARRTKAERFDIEVEAALEEALDFEFDDNALSGSLLSEPDTLVEVKDEQSEPIVKANAREESNAISLDNPDTELLDLENLEQQIALAAEEFVAQSTDTSSGRSSSAQKSPVMNSAVQRSSFGSMIGQTVSQNSFNGSRSSLSNSYTPTSESLGSASNRIADLPDTPVLSADPLKVVTSLQTTRSTSEQAPSTKSSQVDDIEEDGIKFSEIDSVTQDDNGFSDDHGFSRKAPTEQQDGMLSEDVSDAADIFVAEKAERIERERALLTKAQETARETLLNQQVRSPKRTKKRFSSPLYWTTTALSALWGIGGIITGYRMLPADQTGMQALGSLFSSANGLVVTAGTIVPILMFWGFAQLARRASELQDVVFEMTDATMRLLEPDTASKDQVASLGQSIRREVEAMGDGIDRTMSRASELEALLQSEVNNLEQAYSENETRIRSLIVELANEREAVSTHAEHVKTTITGAKDQLTREFNSIADHINATAESFTSTLSETLNARWGELVNEFNMANEGVAQQLSHKFVETVQSFDASRGRFFAELDNRFEQIDQHTEQATNAVAERLGGKMDDFVKIVQNRTEDVEGRFNTLTGRLANSGEKIIEAVNESVSEIEKRSTEIDNRLRSTADKVLDDFENRFDNLDKAIIDRGATSLSAFGEQIARLENRAKDLPSNFDKVAENAVDEFANQISKVEEQFSLLSGRLAKSGTNITDAIAGSLSEIEDRSDDVDSRLNATANKILSEFEARFDKLDNAIIDRSGHSLTQFSSQISKLQQHATDLSSSFDAATNLAIQAFEKRLDQVDESLNERSTSLIRSFIARTEALEESTEKLNVALDTHVGRINEAFQLRTRDIAQTLTGGRDGILSVVEETKVRLSHEMEIVGTTIARLVDERAGGFIHQFTEGREKLSDTLENETVRIVETVGSQISLLSQHVSEIEHKLLSNISVIDERAQEQAGNLADKASQFEETVIRSFNTAREVIETQAKNLDVRSDAMRDSLRLNSEALNEVLGEQTEVLEGRISRIREMIAQGNLSFTEALGQHVSQVQRAVSDNDSSLKETFLEHLKNLEDQTARLRSSFTDSQQGLMQSLDGRIDAFKDSLVSSQLTIESTLSNHGQMVSDRAIELQSNLVQTLSTVDEKLEQQGKLLDQRAINLRDAVDHNSVILERSFESQTAIIDERTETMQKAIEIGVNNVRTVLEQNAVALSDTLRDRISEVSGVLSNESEKAENQISVAGAKLTQSVMGAVSDVERKLADRALFMRENINEIENQLNSGMTSIEGRVASTASSLTDEAQKAENIISAAGIRLAGSVVKAAESVEQQFAQRDAVIKNNVHEIENQINTGLDLIGSRMADATASLSEEARKIESQIGSGLDLVGNRMADAAATLSQEALKIENQIGSGLSLVNTRMADAAIVLTEEALKAENMINSAGERLAGSVVQAAQTVEQKLADRSVFLKENVSEIEERISTGIGSIESRISEITQKAANQLLDKTEDLQGLTEQLQIAATKTSDSLGILTNQFSEQLKEVTRAAEERLRSENNTFINNFSSRTEETVTAVQIIKSDISDSVAQLLDRLDTSNGTIQLTVNALRSSVNDVDHKLSDVTSEFKQNIGQLAESFTSTSNALNNDLQRFGGLSHNALTSVAKFSQQFDDHAKILSEATTLLDNSHDVFAEKLDERQIALNTLASGLVEKSDEIAGAMQNCEQLISTIMKRTEERARTSTEQLQSSLGELISEASNRFEGATEEIRKSAEEIREELARTRADLSRGVRTLPSQTKEYTEAMRKAVIEQIEALKELSGIVEESGRLFDVSNPSGVSNSLGMSSSDTLVAKPRGVKPMPTMPTAVEPALVSADITGNEPSDMGGIATLKVPDIGEPVRAAAPRPSQPSQQPQQSQSRGWVSDLLARASRDDLEKPAINSISSASRTVDASGETLNSLSAEIVQSIDREAINQLWQHYRRGQRNITPSNLYTVEGLRTFEKIKHKYALDGEFRRAVSQYIADFERLLGDVTKNGGSNDTVREYLTSETGKVYTMLAHASGRIQ